MKILDIQSIRKADAFTIENEPISSFNLMKRAGEACADFIIEHLSNFEYVTIFVGPGNNGGDGLVIARSLLEFIDQITVAVLDLGVPYSTDFQLNYNLIKEEKDLRILHIKSIEDIPNFIDNQLVVDAIFGSGLNRPLSGLALGLIKKINSSGCPVVAVDIPSGLNGDLPSLSMDSVIHAHLTLSLEFPKYSMLFPESAMAVGQVEVIPIGLHPEFVDNLKPKAVMLEDLIISGLLKSRAKFSHKGSYGHGLLLSGSKNKSGAAALAAKAALRSGIGLLTVHMPEKATATIRSYIPEAMLSIDSNMEFINEIPDLSPFNAIAIGPGIGLSQKTQNAFKLLIQNSLIPLIIDADALNILSENKTWFGFLPAGSILTPHPKEFDRLSGNSDNHFERVEKQIALSMKYRIFIILKGAHTSITTPDGFLYFNNTGNPGMATAGSGDVLTGILLSLFAQGYSAHDSCLVGAYLHGLAGDLALKKQSEESVIASDIIDFLGKAFKALNGNR